MRREPIVHLLLQVKVSSVEFLSADRLQHTASRFQCMSGRLVQPVAESFIRLGVNSVILHIHIGVLPHDALEVGLPTPL